MTVRADAMRERAATRLGLAAALSAALAIALVARDADRRDVESVSGPLLAKWSEEANAAQIVRVQSAAGVLTLERGETGWRLRERGGHPVAAGALGALDAALSSLALSGARTRDPRNHDRLGVLDPETAPAGADGVGVRLTIADADGGVLADLIFGARREDGVYVRRPDEDQTYAADGAVPDLANPATWVDLDVLDLARADLARVRITPDDGSAAYVLARATPQTADFALVDPASGWRLLTAGAANGPGGASSGLRFVDVRAATELDVEPIARQDVTTFDGLHVRLDVAFADDGEWARISADGTGAAAEAADAITARTQYWAYKLPQYAAERLVRSLDRIAEPVAGETLDDGSDNPEE